MTARKTAQPSIDPGPRRARTATRYAAFLRGVSPVNAKMAEVARAFESAGFADVATVLASGNVLFTARAGSIAMLERRCEAALAQGLGRPFATIVRRVEDLRALLDANPYAGFELPPGAKRVVTFLRKPPAEAPALPIERGGARILVDRGGEVLSAYVPGPRGPVFMSLLEKTFGKDITTRTWETVQKVSR
jgi:uncharacterized protein (DUF1697 family)